MKTLISVEVPLRGKLHDICGYLEKALSVELKDYFTEFNLNSKEEAIEHIITGGLAEQSGTWFFKYCCFPPEGSHFFNRIMAQVDCLLIVRMESPSNQLYVEVAKARLTSLEPGDSFVIPRTAPIDALITPYNFAEGQHAPQ